MTKDTVLVLPITLLYAIHICVVFAKTCMPKYIKMAIDVIQLTYFSHEKQTAVTLLNEILLLIKMSVA